MRTCTNTLATEHGAMVGFELPTRAAATWTRRAKNIALIFAAPFIGLAYLLGFPVIVLVFLTIGPVLGLGALAWAGGKALVAG